jgi:hypothetical protein
MSASVMAGGRCQSFPDGADVLWAGSAADAWGTVGAGSTGAGWTEAGCGAAEAGGGADPDDEELDSHAATALTAAASEVTARAVRHLDMRQS